ncbi:MAG: InlB B-repeat-containing protein, partial [Oscillospiraceae bacterium]|nr:InlB B-repeat-containing protein [Oscillospiraceae bacterium]
EGYGGSLAATSAANVERNHALPAAQRPYDTAYASGYRNESILAHEFGHGILNPGMNNNSVVNAGAPANTSMRSEHIAIWTASRATPENPNTPTGRKLWDGATIGTGTYMSKNSDEFMATAVAIWFDAMAGSNSWSNDGYGMVCTRDQLRRYDTPFYNFLSRTLPETKILSDAWASNATNTNPYIHPKPAEPTGRWGPSIKIKSAMTIANNPAGSGIQMYIPFNAAANTITNAELWWDIDTDIMRWYLEPDATESYFRINKKMGAGYTQNAQRDNLVLMPNNSSATSGANIVLAQRNTSDESQWWAFNKQTNGTFIITNKSNPALAITLVGDATAKGTRIALGSATSAASRFWRLDGGTLPIMSDAPPPTTYTVTFNPNGGSVTPTSAVTGTNGRLTSLPTPTRNGYSFSGWFTDATGGASVTTGTVYSANTTIFARWTANSITVATTATTTVATTTPIATTSQSTSASTSVSTSTSQSVSVSTSSSATVSSPTSSLTTASTTSSITTSASVTTSDSTASTASTSSESTSTSTSTDTTTSTSSQPTTTTSQSTTTTSQSTTTTSQTTTTTSQSTTTASLPTLTTSQSTTTTTTSQSTTTTSQPTTSQPTTTTMSQPTITTPMATSAPDTETSDETSATTEAEVEPRLIGDVDCNGTVTINDALEILKFLAKLPNEISANGKESRQWNASLIVGGSDSPTINDALEILKKLAKLENKIDSL